MDDRDRYLLLQSMLEGDREARQVLADLLEEQGERGLAQWARRGRRGKHREVEFAIMLLPWKVALRMGTQIVAATRIAGAATVGPDLGVRFVLTWLDGEQTREQARQFLGYPVQLQLERARAFQELEVNACATEVWDHLREAMACVILSEPAGECSFLSEKKVRDSMRRIAVRTRNNPAPSQGISMLDWQVNYIKTELTKLTS